MATHTEPERTEASHNESIQTEARFTPLTEEAKAHLWAAGSLVDDRFNAMQCMIESAIGPLKESNRHVGFDLTLSDDEVFRIVRSVEGALSYGQAEVVAPVYARFRGERPHVENGDEPSANGGGESEGRGDAAAAKLDHGLAWEAITTLALAERLAMDFCHRFVGKRMLHELAEVRHRIEDEIGVDGHLSERIVGHAGERYAAWQEGREEGVDA